MWTMMSPAVSEGEGQSRGKSTRAGGTVPENEGNLVPVPSGRGAAGITDDKRSLCGLSQFDASPVACWVFSPSLHLL